jgi:hypothetical protein
VDTDREPFKVIDQSGGDDIVWYAPFLVDDSFPLGYDFSNLGNDCNSDEEHVRLTRDGDEEGGLDLAYHSCMIFYISPTELADTEW